MNDSELAALALTLAEAADAHAIGTAVAGHTGADAWLLGLLHAEELEPLAAVPSPAGPTVPYRPPLEEGELSAPAEVSPRFRELTESAAGSLHLRTLRFSTGGEAVYVADRPLPERAVPLVSAALERVHVLREDPSLFRDRALSTISHDLRGPLNVIGFASSMLKSAVGDDERDLVEKIRRASRQMEGMIRDLLDLGELEAGRLELRRSETTFETVLGHVRAAADPLAENAGVDLTIEVEAPGHTLVCEASRLAQAVALLVDGACRHAKKGQVTIRANLDGGTPFFEVEDSGSPLDEETRGSLFMAKRRGEEPHPRAKGLRLTLARRLVEAHGGRLEALESPGVRIRVTLPTIG